MENSEAILTIVYRVLQTRGRDGFVIFVPPASAMDQTAQALSVGVRNLREAETSVLGMAS